MSNYVTIRSKRTIVLENDGKASVETLLNKIILYLLKVNVETVDLQTIEEKENTYAKTFSYKYNKYIRVDFRCAIVDRKEVYLDFFFEYTPDIDPTTKKRNNKSDPYTWNLFGDEYIEDISDTESIRAAIIDGLKGAANDSFFLKDINEAEYNLIMNFVKFFASNQLQPNERSDSPSPQSDKPVSADKTKVNKILDNLGAIILKQDITDVPLDQTGTSYSKDFDFEYNTLFSTKGNISLAGGNVFSLDIGFYYQPNGEAPVKTIYEISLKNKVGARNFVKKQVADNIRFQAQKLLDAQNIDKSEYKLMLNLSRYLNDMEKLKVIRK